MSPCDFDGGSWSVAHNGHMPKNSPYKIVLSYNEREILNEWSRKYTLPYFQVVRAKIILLAAAGQSNEEIAKALSLRREAVSQWRKRFFHERLAGLEDRPRSGRPRGRIV